MASELLKRSEVKEADTWNVKDMYPTTEAWENELKIITGIVDKIASNVSSVAAMISGSTNAVLLPIAA